MSNDPVSTQRSPSGLDDRKRWLALIVVCLGVLMIVLDGTVVYVALPSLRHELALTESSLIWVVNAYTLAFSGSLLLSGRLGDLYGNRKLFLIGVALFTIASLGCGIANRKDLLIAARGVQGLAGAVVVAVALSLLMNMFTKDTQRAQAVGVYGFVCAVGGSIGVLLGGTLTGALNWHWIFLVNVPIGVAVYAVCFMLLPRMSPQMAAYKQLDVWGAITVTASLMLAVYAVVNRNETGEAPVEMLVLLGCSVVLFAAFLTIEARVPAPLMPIDIFRRRNFLVANTVGVLWAAGASASFFVPLYMQGVLGYEPMQVGLAFLPGNMVMAIFALGLSAKLVLRFGIRAPVGVGMLLGVIGLVMFVRAPVNGNALTHILPSMILIGLGGGIACNPLLLAVMSEIEPKDSGLASGIFNTACLMGSALGLAALVSFAGARTNDLLASGAATPVALIGGYHLAFLLGGLCGGTAALIGATFLRTKVQTPALEYVRIGATAPASSKD